MLLRQLFDPATSTYTYLLADPQAKEAILIDTVREQVDRDTEVLEGLGLRLVATLETHVHADHVTGAWRHKQRWGSQMVYPAASGVQTADQLVDEGDEVHFGRFAVVARRTPGHTDGCTTYVTQDLKQAFTGDALLIRGSGRTDFQQGDPRQLYRSVWDQILSLPDDTALYPGHDYKGRTVTTVAEEKALNPRLGAARTEDEFVSIMENLNLPYPRFIDEALPANLVAGREDGVFHAVPRSAMGVRHVSPSWVQQHADHVRLIDVRQPEEFEGPLGHLPDAELVPLAELLKQAEGWDRDAAIVTICRSSGRSDRAALALEGMGFRNVASMVGGMQAIREGGSR